jgi:hypothetical protein
MQELIESMVMCGMFAVLFVFFGVRRIASARSGNIVASAFWGVTGLVIGLVFAAGGYWLVRLYFR